jgi:hypothetical protein
MSDYADHLRELAEPSTRGDRVKVAIDRAARLSGLSYWRTFDLWYRKARKVEDFEIAAISEALRRKTRMEAHNELSQLRSRIEILEARYAQSDADFHRADIDGLGQILRPVR